MKVSIALMCHHTRKQFIPYLKSKLGNCKVFIDDGTFGLKRNAIRCWSSYDKSADWHIVIQDDAIICDDFLNKIQEYLSNADGIVSFFLSKRTKNEKLVEDDKFFYRNWLTGAVGLAIETKYLNELCNFLYSASIENDDTIMAHFFKNKNILIKYTKPSLIDHRTGIKSIVEGNIVSQRRGAYENIPI